MTLRTMTRRAAYRTPALARKFLLFCAVAAATGVPATGAAAFVAPSSAARVEARSGDLLVVGLLNGDRLSIRVSRVLDNAPVHDASVAVLLRGTTYPTVAEADGSYALTAKDLTLPGDAAIEFRITQGHDHEALGGVLKIAAASVVQDDHGNGRQMWWWALNFSVCIGFLWMFSRRKKAAQD